MLRAASDSSSVRGVVPRWLLASTTLGSAAMLLALEWDFSWHRSIGRDTFFTPPHVLLYGGAVFSCLAAATAILGRSSTRGDTETRGVRVWGFEAPLGAFAVAWGGLAMLAGGVFDSWWHGVYGLDVVIQSFPHIVILSGLLGAFIGNLLLAMSSANGASQGSRGTNLPVLLAGAILLTVAVVANSEYTFTYLMHGARFYCVVALSVPVIVFGVGGATGERFGATYVTLIHTALLLLLILVLPLFAAEPRLGPILHRINHFVPPSFPLLVAPAVALVDFWAPRVSGRGPLAASVARGGLFLAAFTLLEWPFARFLQTPFANNRLFAGNEFAFFQAESSYPVRHLFYPTEASLVGFWLGMATALALAVCSTRCGFALSRWLRGLYR